MGSEMTQELRAFDEEREGEENKAAALRARLDHLRAVSPSLRLIGALQQPAAGEGMQHEEGEGEGMVH
jgi:hypothetical protein